MKIVGLTYLNTQAIREVFPQAVEDGDIKLTATTAEVPEDFARTLEFTIARLTGRGHPRASLYAVRRKAYRAQLDEITVDDGNGGRRELTPQEKAARLRG